MIVVNIRKMVKASGLTYQEVHERTGISRNTMSMLERGRSKGIQFGTLEKLIEVFNCEVADLIEYKSDSKIATEYEDLANEFERLGSRMRIVGQEMQDVGRRMSDGSESETKRVDG